MSSELTSSNLLKRLLKLPPVEKRRDISRSWLNRLTFFGRLSNEGNDSYIYWRCYVICALVTIAYTVLYQLDFFYDLELPIPAFHQYDQVRNFCYSFSFFLAFPLTLFLSVYGLFLMQANVDLEHTDLTWWEPEDYRQKTYFKHGTEYAQKMVTMRFIIFVVLYPLWGWGSTLILSYHPALADSNTYQIFISFILVVSTILILPVVPYATALFYQMHKGYFAGANPMTSTTL